MKPFRTGPRSRTVRQEPRPIPFFAGTSLGFALAGWLAGGWGGLRGLTRPPLSPSAAVVAALAVCVYLLPALSAAAVWTAKSHGGSRTLRLFLLMQPLQALWPVLLSRMGWRITACFWALMLAFLAALFLSGCGGLSRAAWWLALPAPLAWLYAAWLSLGLALFNH